MKKDEDEPANVLVAVGECRLWGSTLRGFHGVDEFVNDGVDVEVEVEVDVDVDVNPEPKSSVTEVVGTVAVEVMLVIIERQYSHRPRSSA